MSLLDRNTVNCMLLDKKRTPDGEGGFFVTWAESAEFMAAITLDTSIEARVAEKQGVTNIYTVITAKAMQLDYGDVFRRAYDGKVFRVTSDGQDKATPAGAMLDMRQTTAEEWELTQ